MPDQRRWCTASSIKIFNHGASLRRRRPMCDGILKVPDCCRMSTCRPQKSGTSQPPGGQRSLGGSAARLASVRVMKAKHVRHPPDLRRRDKCICAGCSVAAPRLRLCAGQCRPRHPGLVGLPRPSQHSAHGALYRADADPVQGLLAVGPAPPWPSACEQPRIS